MGLRSGKGGPAEVLANAMSGAQAQSTIKGKDWEPHSGTIEEPLACGFQD
jgi:hypothetical protein